MVGVPKSKRCNFCRTRKTKCDEKWPTCGTCARAGKICSGPRKTYKFVANGNHREGSDVVSHASETSRPSSSATHISTESVKKQHNFDIIISDSKHTTASVANVLFHLVTKIPKRPQLSQTERIITNFLSCLNSDPGTGHDLRIIGMFVPLLPQYLGDGNTPLDHAVELLLTGWTSCRRGLPSETWLNLNMYNRALRSLQTALDDNKPAQITRTLTALCILQKIEILYDFQRGSNQENHAAGLIAVVNKAGPGQPINDMLLHVLFEGIFHMLQEDIRQGRECYFHTPQWMSALRQAIDTSFLSPIQMQMYHLWAEMTAWPGLARLVNILRKCPWNKVVATELYRGATVLSRFLNQFDQSFVVSLFKTGAIVEVENTAHSTFPTGYRFDDYQTAKVFCTHACSTILACRFLQEASRVLGIDDSELEAKARRFSQRIWKSTGWVSGQIPLGVDFTASLVFSYESGNEKERQFCIDSLRKMDAYRRPLPIGEWVDETIMANAKAYSGRLPFIKTQDPRVEFDGIGCRS